MAGADISGTSALERFGVKLYNNAGEERDNITLMRELGLFEYVPAMCHLDYAMSDAGGVTNFVREYTLASGGPYCDCGYKRKVVR